MRRPVLVASLCAAALLAAPQVGGQVSGNPPHDSEATDVVVDGMPFRVPLDYFRPPSPEALKASEGLRAWYRYEKGVLNATHLAFFFWISDAKSPRIPRGTPQQKLVGPGSFWPPEPGRPYLTVDDFLVRVVEARPRDLKGGVVPLHFAIGPNRTVENYGRLECGIDRANVTPIVCRTPIDDDVVVTMSAQ